MHLYLLVIELMRPKLVLNKRFLKAAGTHIMIVNSAHFGYTSDSQNEWGKEYQHCGEGKRQSPVHIDSELAMPLAFPAVEMVGFHNLMPSPLLITNNGHSVEIKSLIRGYAQIFGAFLPGKYDVEAIHFHWGSKNNKGSEHILNQMRFPMEMHIVTKNQKYINVSEAMEYPDGLAVLAVFYNLQERPSRALKQITRQLSLVRAAGSSAFLDASFPLAQLVPKSTDLFYSYHGSLTTPPCSESVTWIVFPDPMPISYTQIALFRQLSSGHNLLVDNFRHIQKLGSRRIYVRRYPTEYSAGQWNQTANAIWNQL